MKRNKKFFVPLFFVLVSCGNHSLEDIFDYATSSSSGISSSSGNPGGSSSSIGGGSSSSSGKGSSSSATGNDGSVWLISTLLEYTKDVGSAELSYTYANYTDDNHYKRQLDCVICPAAISIINSRDGNTEQSVSDAEMMGMAVKETTTTVYHEQSGLVQSKAVITTAATAFGNFEVNREETNYTIQLLGTEGGISTYKQTASGTGEYSVYKVQNGIVLEQKSYSGGGLLSGTTTYSFPSDEIIRARVPTFTLATTDNSYQICEVAEYSDAKLVINIKTYADRELTSEYEITYVKWSP